MNYLFILIVGFFLISAGKSNAQFRFESLIRSDASFFTTDPLGNIYIAEEGNVIKIDQPTEKKKYFSNPMYGNFQFIDSSDPLNIMAFSADLGIIVFLDKNLVEKESFSVYKDSFSDKPELVCNSRLEGFWVYYPEKWQFFRINRKKQVLTSTISMNKLEYDFFKPCFMIETSSRLFVSDYENGIFVFDLFGGFLFKIPLKNVCTFQVKGNHIIYFTKKHLCLYDFFLHQERLFLLTEDEIGMGRLNHPYLYILTKQGIKKYFTNIGLF